MGTTEAGTNSHQRHHPGAEQGDRQERRLPVRRDQHPEADAKQTDKLRADIVRTVDDGRAVVANIAGTSDRHRRRHPLLRGRALHQRRRLPRQRQDRDDRRLRQPEHRPPTGSPSSTSPTGSPPAATPPADPTNADHRRAGPHQGAGPRPHGRGRPALDGRCAGPARAVSRRSRPARRPRGRVSSSRLASQPSGRETLPGELVRPRGWPRAATGNGSAGSSLPSRSSSWARLSIIASERRSSPPTGKPLRYQATCLRKSVQPSRSLPSHSTSSSACRRMVTATSPRLGQPPLRPAVERGLQVGEEPRPAQAAAPDDHAVAAGVRAPSAARRRPPRCRRCRAPARRAPASAWRSRPSRRCRSSAARPYARAGRPPRRRRPGRQPGLDVRQVVVVDALAHLDGDRHPGG